MNNIPSLWPALEYYCLFPVCRRFTAKPVFKADYYLPEKDEGELNLCQITTKKFLTLLPLGKDHVCSSFLVDHPKVARLLNIKSVNGSQFC